MPTKWNNFTLVEILIATFILAIGMLCILSVFPYAIKNTSLAINRSKAASTAHNALVFLKYYSHNWSPPEFYPAGKIYVNDNNQQWNATILTAYVVRIRVYSNDIFLTSYTGQVK